MALAHHSTWNENSRQVQFPPLPVSIWLSNVPMCGRFTLLRDARQWPQATTVQTPGACWVRLISCCLNFHTTNSIQSTTRLENLQGRISSFRGRRKRATVDRVERGRGSREGKVESANWSSVFKNAVDSTPPLARAQPDFGRTSSGPFDETSLHVPKSS